MFKKAMPAGQIEAACGGATGPLAATMIVFIFLGMPNLAQGQCLGKPASPRLPAGLKLTIRAEKPVAEISRPVIIHVELFNESDKSVSVSDRFPERDYELHVRDSSGKEVPLTDWGRRLRTLPVRGSQNTLVIGPGEKYTNKEDLAELYSVSVPGNYTVEACRDVYVWGNIYSNKIVVPFVIPAVP